MNVKGKRFFVPNGQRIISARQNRGWTQDELAQNSDVSKRTIENAEKGDSIQFSTARSIAAALELTIEDLEGRARNTKNSVVNLPIRPTTVIGREATFSQISTRILEKRGIVSIHGWPGIGKSTLAVEIGYRLADQFDGVIWTSVGNHADFKNLRARLQTLGRLFGEVRFALEDDCDELSRLLARFLHDKAYLIIVDDVWEVQHALLFCIGGPKCATVLTSRNRLLSEELSPDPADRIGLDGLDDDDALELLQKNAGVLVSEHRDACIRLVRILDGLPLAIQVAGRYLSTAESRGLGAVEQLIASLESDISPLLSRIAPTRYGGVLADVRSSVFAIIDKSYQRLDTYTKLQYACLSVMPPAPHPVTVEDMTDGFGISSAEAIQTATKLVDAGLLEPAGFDENGLPQFKMHALLKAHAASIDDTELDRQLKEQGEP